MTHTPELPGPMPWKSGGGRFDEWIEDANGDYISLDVALAYLNAAPTREAQARAEAYAAGHAAGQAEMRERAAKVAALSAKVSNQMISECTPYHIGGNGDREMAIGARNAAQGIEGLIRALPTTAPEKQGGSDAA